MAQRIKNMPAMQKTQVQSVGLEDPLKKEVATHSSILAWRIPRTEEPGRLQSVGLRGVRHDWESMESPINPLATAQAWLPTRVGHLLPKINLHTYVIITRLPRFTLGFTLGCICYGFWQIHYNMYLSVAPHFPGFPTSQMMPCTSFLGFLLPNLKILNSFIQHISIIGKNFHFQSEV